MPITTKGKIISDMLIYHFISIFTRVQQSSLYPLEKIRYRILIPEFYVKQICKHGRSVTIG